jgi:hypothetical protein
VRTEQFCTGYHLQTDRESLNQSKTVISKHSPPNQRTQISIPSFLLLPTNASSPTGGTWQSLPHTRQRITTPTSISSAPGDSFAYFFFNEYVFNDTPVLTTIYDTLPRLFHKASADNPLRAVILALGMACYSNAWGVPEAMMYANMEYAKALHLVNSALRDPFGAKQDDIFLIVILLGLYEVNVLLNWF